MNVWGTVSLGASRHVRESQFQLGPWHSSSSPPQYLKATLTETLSIP